MSPSRVIRRKVRSQRGYVDWRLVKILGGRGGNGRVSFHAFRRGPSGGNGGNGGNVIFRAVSDMDNLRSIEHAYGAGDGDMGCSMGKTGSNGKDVIVQVPTGTVIKEEGVVIADLSSEGESCIVARGGRGGVGNLAFASATDQAPKKATNGTEGDNKSIEVELKTIADVGMVGLPNAGKSTLLRTISNALPAVASYPFTTLTPHIGVVEGPNFSRLKVADIPGLLPNAHTNYGLGHAFLRHIERCSLLIYVLDATEDLYQQQTALEEELHLYNPTLPNRAKLIIANKLDCSNTEQMVRDLSSKVELPIMPVSGLKRWNIDNFIRILFETYFRIIGDK